MIVDLKHPPTNDEKRWVARNLRRCGSGKRPRWGFHNLLHSMGIHLGDYQDEYYDDAYVYNRLAELIDPGPECNREALLALADEMEQKESDFGSSDSNTPYVKTVYASLLPIYAHRIREALGVEP